ncbi:MAG: hypothetical protein U0794_01565 [Isosphaeraceae bacterium]
MSTRNFQPGDSYGISFTIKSASGSLTNADALPTGTLYRNGVADGAVAVTVSSSATGVYQASCTVPAGYAVADRVSVLITATIGGVATGEFVDHIRLVGFPNNAFPNAQAGQPGGLPTLDASAKLIGCKLDAADVTATTVAANLDVKVSTRSTYAGGVVLGVTNPVTVGTNNDKSGYALAANGVDLIVVETGLNLRQANAIQTAALAGVLAGANTNTVTVAAAGLPATNRITAGVDPNGNRNSVTLNIPA